MNHPLYKLLSQLENARIHFTLGRYRPDTVLITLTLIGERVEVDVFSDGRMEVSRFKGNEDVVGDSELLESLIAQNTENLDQVSLCVAGSLKSPYTAPACG